MVEAKLIRAAEAMPVPRRGFDGVLAAVPERNMTRRHLRPVLVALAVVFLLAGCTTAYGAYKVSRGTWNRYISHNWADAEREMGKYGITLPEEYDGAGFREMSVGSSVPHGTSYWKAAFSGYRSVHVYYGTQEDLSYGISVGDTKDPYWMTYFGYGSDARWTGDGDHAAVEYGGFTIYTDDTCAKATWVDETREICVSVTGFDSGDPLSLAKWIIDNME